MSISRWLGFEAEPPQLTENDRARALRRIGGDPSWLEALGILEQHFLDELHRSAVASGDIAELFPCDQTDTISTVASPIRTFSNVRIVIIEPNHTSIYDQDNDQAVI